MREKKHELQELARAEIPTRNTVVVMVRLVNIENNLWVDIRKWMKWGQDGSYHPSAKKGICLELATLTEGVIPAILAFSNNTGHNRDASSTVNQGIDNPMPDQKAE